MSLDNENVSDTNLEKLDELTNKLNRCNKNVKLVLEWLEKLNKASETKSKAVVMLKKAVLNIKIKSKCILRNWTTKKSNNHDKKH